MEEPRQNILEKSSFPAEEVSATGNVEKQPIPAIERHHRRITVAPVGNGFQKPAVGRRIFFHDIERRIHGARFGNALILPQSQPLGEFVQRRQTHGVVELAATDERRFFRTPFRTPGKPPALACDAICGQMREAERQNALIFRLETE